MKKLKSLLLILIGLTILSCSSDDNSELTLSELITQNSPWTFKNYEMLNIVDAGNSIITKQEIENDINTSLNGLSFNFNQNGSGYTSSPGEPNDNWQWEIISNNQLKITFDNNNGEFELYYNITATSTLLKMELESVTYDSNANYEVSHYGIYHFE